MRRILVSLSLITVLTSSCVVAGNTTTQPTVVPTVRVPPTVTALPASPSATTQAPIIVTSPAEGAMVQSPVRIAGSASVFEASVSIRIKNAAGQVVAETFTMATQGAPGRGDYSASVPVDFVGAAVVEVFSQSARDGSDQFLVQRNIVIGR